MTRDEMLDHCAQHHRAVMVTLERTGRPHSVPVLSAADGDTLLISGTRDRVRTRHLERDPRCTVTVFAEDSWWRWVTVTGTCELRTENAVAENERLYEMITGHPPDDLETYRRAMVDEKRLVYALRIEDWYPRS